MMNSSLVVAILCACGCGCCVLTRRWLNSIDIVVVVMGGGGGECGLLRMGIGLRWLQRTSQQWIRRIVG